MADYERTQQVGAPASNLFTYLSDVGNLPDYFERMTAAEPAGGEAVHTRANLQGQEVEGEAWFRVLDDQQRIEWGAQTDSDYHGWLDVTGDGSTSQVTVHIETSSVEDEQVGNDLERTLQNIQRVVEDAGGQPAG